MIQCWTIDYVRTNDLFNQENLKDENGIIIVGASDIEDKEEVIEKAIIDQLNEDLYRQEFHFPFVGFRNLSIFKSVRNLLNPLEYVSNTESKISDLHVLAGNLGSFEIRELVFLTQVICFLLKEKPIIQLLEFAKEKSLIFDFGIDISRKIVIYWTRGHKFRVSFFSHDNLDITLSKLETKLLTKNIVDFIINKTKEEF